MDDLTLTVMLGVPGSGKSQWAQWETHSDSDLVVVSADAIRAELGKEQYDPADNGVVFDLFHERLAAALLDGKSAIADATNLRRYARTRLRTLAEDCDARTRLVCCNNIHLACVRNAHRTGSEYVPESDMARMILQFSQAVFDVEHENYDQVETVGLPLSLWDMQRAVREPGGAPK